MSTANAVVDQHHGGHDDHHGHEEHSFTGIPSKKILMWAFLASDCMFFGTLISTYIIYHGKSLIGPYPLEILSIPVSSRGPMLSSSTSGPFSSLIWPP